MKKRTKWSLGVAIGVMVFIPIFFTGVAIATDNWYFFWYSLIPTFLSGSIGLQTAIKQAKKERAEACQINTVKQAKKPYSTATPLEKPSIKG